VSVVTDVLAVASDVHRFSLDEYHRLIECGGFDEDARVELIEGVITNMSPRTREHDNAIRWLNRWLMRSVDEERFEVGVQTALTLERSEPEPDLSVFGRDAPRPFHPGTAALVIEVAVSSRDYDLRVKPNVYASAGIEEYWVVDLERRRVVVHRQASADGYGSVSAASAGERVLAEALTLPALDVAELFAAAFAQQR
jgi:Uma2 family endonuclease